MRKEQLEMALEVAVNYIKTDKANMSPGSPAHMCVTSVLKRIDNILHPAPAYEEVPYERWAVVAPSGYIEATFSDEAQAMEAAAESINAVGKISGTLRRPLPRPVERSVEVEAEIADDRAPHYYSAGTIIGIAPFRDHPEVHGKRVTLTATVVEEER